MLRGTLSASSSWWTRPWYRRPVKASKTIGPVGTLVRFFALLLLGIFFGLPLVWLILAPTKTDVQLTQNFPLSVGSLAKIGEDWPNLLSFDNGVIVQWSINSVLYAVATLILALAVVLPAGYALATSRPK
ncbi:MAG TPA: hypothetical protein VFB12_27955, partial [Ktedonobacteraceae bacterium]|nr:hypothetical protein [Ktedonobacteraceae bacterium]